MSNKVKKITPIQALLNLIVALFTVSCVFPIIWMSYTSLKSGQEYQENILSLPSSIYFDNYIQVMRNANFGQYFYNSFIVSLLTLVLVIIFASITGYFLSRFKFKGRKSIYAFFMLGLVVPTHAWLLPMFIQFNNLGILDKRITLVLPYVTFAMPTAIFLLESFIQSIPIEMEESASMEGCGVWQSLWKIILPLCKPMLATVLILTFNTSWNEFPFALVLITKDSLKTVPVALSMFTGTYTTNYPQLVTALVISIIPVVGFYALFSKKIMEGMVAGAVKG